MEASLSRAKSVVDRFESALSNAAGFDETLASEYNRVRVSLATSFQRMSLDALPSETFPLAALKARVEAAMRELFAGRVDSSLFVVRGYTSPHPDIYTYLASRVGEAVPAWRLRLLTRDAVHTERRTRELRDFGLLVDAFEQSGEAQYRLRGLDPDLTYGAAFQLRKNAAGSTRLSPRDRAAIIDLAEQTADLPERRTA